MHFIIPRFQVLLCALLVSAAATRTTHAAPPIHVYLIEMQSTSVAGADKDVLNLKRIMQQGLGPVVGERNIVCRVLVQRSEPGQPQRFLNAIREAQAKMTKYDVLVVYHTGHGEIQYWGASWTHYLAFDNGERLARTDLLKLIEQRPCRLQALITDCCSYAVERESRGFAFGDIASENGNYRVAQDLFLRHTGLLDLQSSAYDAQTHDGQISWCQASGGVFTEALEELCRSDGSTLSRGGPVTWREALPVLCRDTDRKYLRLRKELLEKKDLDQRTKEFLEAQSHQIPQAFSLPKPCSRSGLGITVRAMRPDEARTAGVNGLLVHAVATGSEHHGLKTGDILIAVEGSECHALADLKAVLDAAGPGATLTFDVLDSSGGRRAQRVTLP